MTHYHLNEATIDLPASLKDRSIHQFMLNDKGPNEFTFVISRADDIPEPTVDAFAERLESELRKALPKFALQEKIPRTIDGLPAVELSYTWRNGDDRMHQRQAVLLIDGPTPDQPKALMLTGTCLTAFNDQWHHAYDDMLASVKLRPPSPQAANDESMDAAPPEQPDAAPVTASATPLPHVFALASRQRTLYVHADEEEACRQVDPLEVEDGL